MVPVLVLLWAGFIAEPSLARAGWPLPAGGSSASGDPEILLTFDDGPHARHTAAILAELDRRDLEAIFFWVGGRLSRGNRIEEQRELIHRAVRDGHVIANHTVTHPNLCLVAEEQAVQEIDENTRALEAVIDMPISLFRAPYGAHCERLRRLLAERSLDHLHWDIDPQEWRHHSIKRTVSFVTRKLKYLDGRAILLMHDTHYVTVKALPQILDWIDEENRRRQRTGRGRPIRIISAVDYLSEQLDLEVLGWMAGVATASADQLRARLLRLIP